MSLEADTTIVSPSIATLQPNWWPPLGLSATSRWVCRQAPSRRWKMYATPASSSSPTTSAAGAPTTATSPSTTAQRPNQAPASPSKGSSAASSTQAPVSSRTKM